MADSLLGILVEHGNELAFLFTSLAAFLLLEDRRRGHEAEPPAQDEWPAETGPAGDTLKFKLGEPVAEPLQEPVEEPAKELVKEPRRLSQTSDRLFGRLRSLLRGGSAERDELFRALEESLVTGDVGIATTEALLSELRKEIPPGSVTRAALESALKHRMASFFDGRDGKPLLKRDGLCVVAMVGVNGVGKTTTAGKLARSLSDQGFKVFLGACDTFRAAAVEQLKLWGERSGVEVVSGAEGAKPSTVAFSALQKASDKKADFLILDTAGRLHTKNNLMQELDAVLKLMARELPGAPHETILVVDATSGQNALEQARVFHGVTPLTGLVVTKLDGTPRGGMLFAIRRELGIPVRYIGLGEKAEDLRPFASDEFLSELFGEPEDEPVEGGQAEAAIRAPRRRRAQ